MPQPDSSFPRPNPLEQQLVEWLLAGDLMPIPALRAQWSLTRVRSRTFDSFGATTTLWLPEQVSPVTPMEHQYDDLVFKFRGDRLYRVAMLHVRDGALHTLEYSVHEAELAAGPEPIEVGYANFPRGHGRTRYGPKRDWQALERYLQMPRYPAGWH